MDDLIKPVDLSNCDPGGFKNRYSTCIILTHDQKILLQQRGQNWSSFPGLISGFGGSIEPGETPMQAIIRELKEELDVVIDPTDLINLGAYTEAVSQYADLIYGYFWHDLTGRVRSCHEGEMILFSSLEEILNNPRVMDDVRYLLKLCQALTLLREES